MAYIRLWTHSPPDPHREDDLHLVLCDWHPLHPHLPVCPGAETPGSNLQAPLLLHQEAPTHGYLSGERGRERETRFWYEKIWTSTAFWVSESLRFPWKIIHQNKIKVARKFFLMVTQNKIQNWIKSDEKHPRHTLFVWKSGGQLFPGQTLQGNKS